MGIGMTHVLGRHARTQLLMDPAADLASREGRGVHVHVGGPGAQSLDKLGELSGQR